MELNFEPKLSCFDKKKGLILPRETSEDLAEFLGIMFGDGWSTKGKKRLDYNIGIAGHSEDDIIYYKTYVIPLFNKLFGIKPKFRKRKHQKTICIEFRSKGLYHFLLNLGFSSPKEDLSIPKWIKNDEKYSLAFLRGFADTDFSINFRCANEKSQYPRITTAIKDRILAKGVFNLIKKFGFTIYSQFDIKRKDKRGFTNVIHCIQINGKKNAKLWTLLIGFNNLKHSTKYLIWRKYGRYIPKTSMRDRLKILEWDERDLNS